MREGNWNKIVDLEEKVNHFSPLPGPSEKGRMQHARFFSRYIPLLTNDFDLFKNIPACSMILPGQ